MPLIDKIEYIAHRGNSLLLYKNDIVYENSVSVVSDLEANVTFSLNGEEFTANAKCDNAYTYFGVGNLFIKNDRYDWEMFPVETIGTVTILFDKPINIDKISVLPNRVGAQYKSKEATLNAYMNNILISTNKFTYKNDDTEIFILEVKYPYTYFIKSENNYYTIANGQLTQVVDTSAGGITDLSLITPVLLQGLTQPKLVVTSEGEIPNDVILSAQVKLQPQTIIQKTDIDIQTAEELSNIVITHSGTSIVRISCSIDSGMSWIKYNGSSWVTTELSEGMDIDTIQGLTVEQLDYLVQSNKLRFAFYIAPQTIDDNIVLQNIKFSVKKEGLWTSCILNTDYTYGRGTDFIEFTAKKAGDYLINYTE